MRARSKTDAAPPRLDPKLMSTDPRLTGEQRRPAYTIIIPAYNEGARLGATLATVLAYVEKRRWDAEVIVVDDGSSDNTAEIVLGYAKTNAGLQLLQNPGNRGKGYSIRNGMQHGRGEILLFSDADLSSPIEEAEKLFAAIASGADVAIGSRWLSRELQTQRQPVHRQILGRIFNLMLRITLGLGFKDTQCGFKAFTRPAANAIFPLQEIERWGFDPELLYLAKKLDFKVVEVPVKWAHSGGTRIHALRDGTRMFGEMLKIRWNGLTGKYAGAKGPSLRPPDDCGKTWRHSNEVSGAGFGSALFFGLSRQPLFQTLTEARGHGCKANSHAAFHVTPYQLHGGGEVVLFARQSKFDALNQSRGYGCPHVQRSSARAEIGNEGQRLVRTGASQRGWNADGGSRRFARVFPFTPQSQSRFDPGAQPVRRQRAVKNHVAAGAIRQRDAAGRDRQHNPDGLFTTGQGLGRRQDCDGAARVGIVNDDGVVFGAGKPLDGFLGAAGVRDFDVQRFKNFAGQAYDFLIPRKQQCVQSHGRRTL